MATIRSEWIKLRTVSMNWVLTVIAVVLPILVAVLWASLGKAEEKTAEQLLEIIQGSSIFSSLLLGVVGVVVITGEFGFNTIRPTFAATPRRSRVLLAKAALVFTLAVVLQIVVLVVGLGVGSTIGTNRGAPLGIDLIPNLWPTALGMVLFAGLFTVLGFGVGMIVRSTPAAIAAVILWALIVENIIAVILSVAGLKHARNWMPYAVGVQMGRPNIDPDLPGRVASGLYFAGFVAVIAIIGAILVNRRDA